MPNKFARSNGDFNNAAIWSGLAASMSATSVPTIGDNAIANTFTIQITGNVACDNITNGTIYGGTAGGVFLLSSLASLSSNVAGGITASPCLSCGGAGTSYIYGNVSTNSASSNCIVHSGPGNLEIVGNVIPGSGSSTFSSNAINKISSTGITKIVGRLVGGQGTAGNNDSYGLLFTSGSGIVEVIGTVEGGINGGQNRGIGISSGVTGIVNVTGRVFGDALANRTNVEAIFNSSNTVSINVIGDVIGAGISPAINNQSTTGSISILGNIISDSRGGSGIASSNPAANVRISGNLIGASNGIPAVYAAAYTVNPIPSQSYIRYANNGTGVGSDAYLYHYTTDSLSAFSIPPVSAVRAGLQYANNTLTGTCQMPAASAVNFGALVDNTTGTAAITSNSLFDVSVASLTASDSLGARLRNSATVESVGRIIASFSN